MDLLSYLRNLRKTVKMDTAQKNRILKNIHKRISQEKKSLGAESAIHFWDDEISRDRESGSSRDLK